MAINPLAPETRTLDPLLTEGIAIEFGFDYRGMEEKLREIMFHWHSVSRIYTQNIMMGMTPKRKKHNLNAAAEDQDNSHP